MSRRGDRDLGKERFWRRLLRRWQKSGCTVRDFCAEHGVSEPAFYAWRRIVAARDQEAAEAPRLADDQAPSPLRSRPRFTGLGPGAGDRSGR